MLKKTAALALVTMALNATAEDHLGTVVVGAGSQPCTAWTGGRAAGPADPQRVYEAMILSWVQGHMTGMNTAQHNFGNDMIPLPGAEYLRSGLDDYCEHRPDDSIWKAAIAIQAVWTAYNLGIDPDTF